MKGAARNDPCPCGSGRKYKHCCLRSDREREARSAAHPQPLAAIAERVRDLRSLVEEAVRSAPPEKARDLQENWSLIEGIATFESMRDEIEAAGRVLDAHRDELVPMFDDPQAVAGRARVLFSHDDFASLRFTAEDVHRAFEAVGYPGQHADDAGEPGKTCSAATLFLADKAYRERAVRRLLALLPKYVAAGRLPDAWLVQACAASTQGAFQESNPFLVNMVAHGLEAWERALQAERTALITELGLDPDRVAGMDIVEVLDWIQDQMADPAKRALVDARYDAFPIMADESTAHSAEVRDGTLRLLARHDAPPICPTPEEVEPWLPLLAERLQPIIEQAQAAGEGQAVPEQAREQATDLASDLAGEIAAEIYTPERRRQLAETLQAYARRLDEGGEPDAATCARGAALMAGGAENPAESDLLVAICYTSLRSALGDAAAADH